MLGERLEVEEFTFKKMDYLIQIIQRGDLTLAILLG